jgi:predicted helicase
MDLHIGYESATPAKLKRVDLPDEKAHEAGLAPKCILKADKRWRPDHRRQRNNADSIPPEAWDYRLGNRSALEWIFDQYKEKKPKDPTIREKFNTYRFADHKEKVIDLLMRVTTVSVRTVAIIESMRTATR